VQFGQLCKTAFKVAFAADLHNIDFQPESTAEACN